VPASQDSILLAAMNKNVVPTCNLELHALQKGHV
jgi:hypothetical protein